MTVGAAGLAMCCGANREHWFKAACPAPSPNTGEFSMYTFWLMSSFVELFTNTAKAGVANANAKSAENFIGEV